MTALSLQTSGEESALALLFIVFMLLYVAMAVAMVVGTVKILNKAGYSGWYALTMLVPILNIVMFLVFAFADWPVLQAARRAQPYPPQGYPPQGYPPQPYRPQG